MSAPLTNAGLADVVRAVEGVVDVYSPRSTLGQVADLAVAALKGAPTAPGEVVVETRGGEVSVATRIAVAASASAASVARQVADALLAELPPEATLTVDVGRLS